MPIIRLGVKLALDECQIQFQHRHWNCSLFDERDSFGNVLDLGLHTRVLLSPRINRTHSSGTRESAYIHALTSAGVAYAMTKACSTGRLESCGCDMSVGDVATNRSIRWTGCSDNVLFGAETARRFVNLREPRTNLLNLHNNRVGIQVALNGSRGHALAAPLHFQAILSSVGQQCKCHGTSGSCELRTCWRSMGSFADIGEKLKELYDDAIEVRSMPTGSIKNRLRFQPRNVRERESMAATYRSNLIFATSSPNYCEANVPLGSWGTRGRICNRYSRAIDGCDSLCCHRGYRSDIVTVENPCNCQFQWCCQVQCQKCISTREISRCL